MSANFLGYYVGRHIAADLDRAGARPGLVLRTLATISGLCILGIGACLAIGVASFALWELGIG